VLIAGLVAGTASAAEHRVGMKGMMYSPAIIKAKVGDTLVFENDDMTAHWVFVATAGHSIDLGNQKEKETRRYTLRKMGKFEIECVTHPEMKIIVEVAP
jgi:plastocyanin